MRRGIKGFLPCLEADRRLLFCAGDRGVRAMWLKPRLRPVQLAMMLPRSVPDCSLRGITSLDVEAMKEINALH